MLAWTAVFDLSEIQLLEVNFFDVGQGDAIFIETPNRHQILIDGGPHSKILEKLNKEMMPWDKTLDLVILTHPEHDHIAGLIEALKRYKVNYILWTGVLQETAEYSEWQKLIQQEGAEIKIAKAGQKIILPTNSGPIKMEILYPFESLEGKRVKNANNSSIVSRLVFGDISFLFTGDIYKLIEYKLIEKGVDLESNILKAGHHGSKTSNSEEFIKMVNPEVVVILVGGNEKVEGKKCDNKKRNRYGHPNCKVLENFEKLGINILRTDENGDIKITSNGTDYKVASSK